MSRKPISELVSKNGTALHDIKDPGCKNRDNIPVWQKDWPEFRRESGRTCPTCAAKAEKPPVKRTRRRATRAVAE
jgi:hypothetical protein